MRKNIVPGSVSLAVLLIAAPAQAAEAGDAAFDAGADAGEHIIVTATRVQSPVENVPASITVLDKQAIDRAQDMGVTELLLRTPGVSFSRNGGYGTATSLRIRGAESDHTVVVIDGVKVNDPSSAGGGYNFANLLTGDIDQIEILRGPQSILWGSQAIGGVVHIVSATPEKPLEGSFDLEAGSRSTVNARAAIGGRSGPLAWRIGAQNFVTDGVSALAPAFGGKESDGYRNRSLSGRAELSLTDNVSIDLRAHYSRTRVEFDGFNADSADYGLGREFIGYAGVNFDLFGGRFKNRIAYTHTDTDRDHFNPDRARLRSFEAEGSNRRWEYQGDFTVSEQIVATLGIENERSDFKSRSPSASPSTPLPAFAVGKAEINSAYGLLKLEPVDGVTLTGGVRYDDHDRYGARTLFSAGGLWRLSTGTTLRASYGEGFKAPTLYQLYSEYGNDALAPEKAHGWEAGIEQSLFGNALTVGATWFDRTTTNQIVYNGCVPGTTNPLCFVPGAPATPRFGYYLNVARSETRGIEAAAALSLGGLTLDGNYSWIVAEDRSAGTANFGNWLPRRPRHAANASASYSFDFGLTLGAAVRWSGKSYDNASNARQLDDYTLVDLRAEYALSDNVRLFARAENLFDEQYMTAYRYGSPGRSLYAGIRGRF
ncbi:MAG: TonB-dependent receptor [Sphingopyxis sp.]|uniref:TonB-dependent receptor plug domain-containing protein n=1 Tax=Sphingopyxis sp. TaxID=1908224 RepID=UPI002ABB35C5|nr:TonB-dependent receptor [Sphingopyxis sp.]MDZ3831468.1 TonB-dependent receptor [Sphingopyxis sp.]